MHAIRVRRMGFHRRPLFAAARAIFDFTTPANEISSRSIALHMEAFGRNRRCFSTWRSSSFPNGDSSYPIDGMKLGDNRPIRCGRGIHLIPGGEYNIEIIDHARWAVNEYNKKHNTSLKFIKVNYVTQQVVSGLMYYIRLEAADGCLIKVYEAKVWEQIWLNFKKLVKFKQIR